MPAGARNWVLDRGHTRAGPEMEQTGSGATARTMSFVSVQPFDWATVNRKVAEAEETWAVVINEADESMIAFPATTLQAVLAIGWSPAVAMP